MDVRVPSKEAKPWVARKFRGPKALGGSITTATFLLTFLPVLLFLAVLQLTNLFLVTEAGHGDSYVLYDAWHLQKTGIIYRDLSYAPYLPAQYSPLVYVIYAASGWITSVNPFLGPRLVALTIFLLCLAVLASITRSLIPGRQGWLWGLLLAGSIKSIGTELWPIQLRGDFPGILFGLAAIRLLLARSRYAVVLAGLCAGFAMQFKITYFAAITAGALWLLLRRQYRNLFTFLTAAMVSSFGLYALFSLREPRMISQMLAISPGIWDVAGCIRLILNAVSEPVILLALSALPLVVLRVWPRWSLLLLFAAASFTVAGLADIQAGGNINYFFEGLLAITPLAALGVLRLIAWSRKQLGVSLFVAGVALIYFFLPAVRTMSWQTSPITPHQLNARNALFHKLESALQGHRIFSAVPRIALLDPAPPLMEPYLLSYLLRLGKFDPKPLVERISNGEFDVVITFADRDASWRGVSLFEAPEVTSAITRAYEPHCTVLEAVLFLPRKLAVNSTLTKDLRNLGCIAVSSSAVVR